MTVYKKLTEARAAVLDTKMSKSGENKYAGFKYFELGDFLPHVHKIFQKVGLCGVFTFEGPNASLTIHDTDAAGSVAFVTPVVYVASPKGQAIQDLGSTHTYLRRYLWLMALELTENDTVDTQELKPKEQKAEQKAAPKQDKNHAFFVEQLLDWANTATTKAELTDLWKKNQEDINTLKQHETELYESLKTRFTQIKENFKG